MNNYSNPVTVTGNPASFEASGSGKILSLSVPFSPIQDLHGYDKPWPAGGGKNIAPSYSSSNTQQGVTFSGNRDCSCSLSGTATGVFPQILVSAPNDFLPHDTALTLSTSSSGNVPSGAKLYAIVYERDTPAGANLETYSSKNGQVTFTISHPYQLLFLVAEGNGINYTGTNATIYYQIEKGSSASSWTPYSNICPISGHTGASVTRAGKNLLNPIWETKTVNGVTFTKNADGTVTANGTASGGNAIYYLYNKTDFNKLSFLVGKQVTFTCCPSGASSSTYFAYGHHVIDGTRSITELGSGISFSFGYESFSNITIQVANGYTVNNVIFKPQLEFGSTATAYEPYNGTTYSVDWTSQAGTVYGGTLDVVTGVLTVDKAVCTENDFTLVSSGISAGGLHWAEFNTTNITINGTSLCSILGIRADGYAGWASTVPCYALTEGVRVRVYCEEGTLADFRAKYAGLQICYTLATPLTYQLTATQIALILGQNYVWSDSNEAVTLTYVIKLFTRYTFKVNNNDYSQFVERDSYVTELTPVFGETIKTMDGVNHTALLRLRGSITVGLNPQTKANTAAICADILQSPVEVQYHCLQRNANVTALMVADTISAQFLSRCLANGDDWNKIEEITLTEL